ncbi:hypothetical protein H9P43_001201 [Blastocladiella emersonii ATCC 22665]|nr:hypothetical protein H9P43_001201 [Blastocladiella emersonii ATCC 22665]
MYSAAFPPSLHTLDISGSKLRFSDKTPVPVWPLPPSLRTLLLHGATIDERGFIALVDSLPPQLTVLDLGNCTILHATAPHQAPHPAQYPALTKLLTSLPASITHLDLSGQTLTNSLWSLPPSLRMLSLNGATFDERGLIALVDAFPPRLTVLDLGNCTILHATAPHWAPHLAEYPALTKLLTSLPASIEYFDLTGQKLTNRLARQFSKNIPPALEVLILNGSGMTHLASMDVIERLPQSIRRLELTSVSLMMYCCGWLVKTYPQLTCLVLEKQAMDAAAARFIETNIPPSVLKMV